MPIPIVTVFKGDRFYLSHCIAQAKAFNPDSDFIFLGDSSTKHYKGIKHFNYNDYFEDAKKFSKIFIHLSHRLSYTSELFCFQRWLILNEFFKKEKLQECFHIDTDVMIYYNLKELRDIYPSFEMNVAGDPETLNHAHTLAHGGSSFINNPKILEKLRNICFEIFEDQKLFESMRPYIDRRFTDMDAIGLLWKRFPRKVITTTTSLKGITMQRAINENIYYEMQNNIQKIYWKNRRPYGKEKNPSHRLIQFSVLHFHGNVKNIMWKYLRLPTWNLRLLWLYNFLAFKLLKYPKRWFNYLSGKNLFPKL